MTGVENVEAGTAVERVVAAVLTGLQDRRGFNYWWGEIDSDIQDEIREELVNVVEPIVAGP
jgi:hypothetical protein